MSTNARIYAVVEIPVEDVPGVTLEEILLNAVLQSDLYTTAGTITGEITKIILRRPGAEDEIFHDVLHLDQLHDEHIDGAGVFDLDEALQGAVRAIPSFLSSPQELTA